MTSIANHFPIRVYYEDTDAGGVVYYANYLRFAERARTELLRSINIDQSQWIKEKNLYFVVSRCDCRFKKPARLDDSLVVKTFVEKITPVRLFLLQSIDKADSSLVTLSVELACIKQEGGPVLIGKDIINALAPFFLKKKKDTSS